MSVKKLFKWSVKLFTGSIRYLLHLEILFKLIGAVVLFPLCEMLFHVGLRFSNIYYISTQNYKQIFHSPLLIAVIFFVFLLFIIFLSIEISCLTIAYQQTYFRSRISIVQLIKIGFRKGIQFLKPKNWILIPFLIFLFPTLYYFLTSSNNSYTHLFFQFISVGFSQYPNNIIVGIILLLLAVGCLISIFSYQYFLCSGKKAPASIAASFRIIKKRFRGVILGLLLWLIAVAAFLGIFSLTIQAIVRFMISVFVSKAIRNAVTLTVLHYVRLGLSFLMWSFFSFAAYAFVAAAYYRNALKEQEPTYAPYIYSKPAKEKAQVRWTVLTMTGLFLMTLLVNFVMLYSVKGSGLGNSFFSDKVTILSHRGVTEDCTENTLTAFQNAVDLQADFIELDVQFSADKVVMVHHDAGLNRCFNVKESLASLTAEELSQIRSPYGDTIPTLEEVFQTFQDSGINFCIELKVNSNSPAAQLSDAVLDLIEAYDLEDRCIIQSFSYKALQSVKDRNENIMTGYILTAMMGMYYDLDDADFFSINSDYITENVVTKIHIKNKKILAWTVNSTSTMEEMIDDGVDGIITDDPLKAREIIYEDETIADTVLSQEDDSDIVDTGSDVAEP